MRSLIAGLMARSPAGTRIQTRLRLNMPRLAKHGSLILGTYSYTGDAKSRDEFRGTGAHNTVIVDDEPQSIPASSFS